MSAHRPTIVLLPGLDGTGDLFEDFRAALGADFPVRVVSYPTDRPMGYGALRPLVEAAFPDRGSYLIVAESFSGPLACAVAASQPQGLVGLVLCASFASPVSLAQRLSGLLPVVPLRAVPAWLIAAILLGRWSTAQRVRALKSVLARVQTDVLRARARAASEVDVRHALGSIQVPVLYLRATRDRLIPPRAARQLQAGVSDLRVLDIDGPHFLLQAAAGPCAAAIRDFVAAGART